MRPACRRAAAWAEWAEWITKPPSCTGAWRGASSLLEDGRRDGPCPLSVPALNRVIDEAIVMNDGSDDRTLARDMIDVHGPEAATVARENARDAALAGQAP